MCHLADVNESLHANAHALERDHGTSVEVCVDGVSMKEHVRRKHRKDNRRRKWERLNHHAKSDDQPSGKTPDMCQGGDASERVLRDLLDFYNHPDETKLETEKEVFRSISAAIEKEHTGFQDMAVEIAYPEPHHSDLPGHGMLIEFCTSEDSTIGKVGHQHGVHVIRCTETNLNVDDPKTEKALLDIIQSKPGIDLLGSLPCGPWTQWTNMNLHRHGEDFAKKLEAERERSRKMLRRFCRLAKAVSKSGGRVTFEWPRFCSGWSLKELRALIRDVNMHLVDFDGCQVGLCDDSGVPFLKRWRIATSCGRTARLFSGLRCQHSKDFKHAVLEGKYTKRSGFYTTLMAEYFVNALYPDLVVHHVPAMPLDEVEAEPQPHRENEAQEQPEPEPTIFESIDSLAMAAEVEDGDALADDEDDRVRESRDERLKKEAQTLEHMTLHDRKNPFCEHCCRGRMLKRYAHRFRADPEEGDMPYEKAKEFGSIIEADNIFPAVESRGMGGEICALIVRDRYSGVSIAYPQSSRDEDSNYESLKNFAGYALSGRTDTVFCSDTAQELTNAASRLCWVLDPSAPNYWPHNAHLERDVRTLKELSRPSHIQAGFHKRLWTLTVDYVSKARSFFSPAPIAKHEKGTEIEESKKDKTRWQIATGSEFDGPKYPLGALVYYRAKGDIGEPTTKPGLFAGWHLSPGLRYKGNLQIIDYEAVRNRSHLHWVPKVIHQRECFLPPFEHLEFPLARAARCALLNMEDVDMVLKREEYNKSLTQGVLPYDVYIDAYPIEDRPPPPGHAYITTQRLDKHGKTPGCSGCEHGHSRHTDECRARFDGIYGIRGGSVPPTPGAVPPTPGAAPPTPAVHPPAVEERASGSGHPRDPLDDDIVPECPPEDIFDEMFPAAVTRQLPRAEVLSRPDALQAIRKEFDGIASMGAWDWNSVDEEANVKKRAIENNETIHLADLLAICSEKHVELEPAYRQLKGRVCYRGDAARTADGRVAMYQTLSASPTSIVAANAIIAFGLLKGHKLSSADAVKAYLQSWLESLVETWVRLPREVWPQEWFDSSGVPLYRKPVIRLLRSLYGHPESGSHWERHLTKELMAMGGVPIEEYGSTFVFPDYHLAMVIYVDDFILSGDQDQHARFWEDLGKRVLIDDIGDLGRFLGRHHTTIKHDDRERFAFDMRAYAKDIVQEYATLTGTTVFKKAHTPFLAKVAERLDEQEEAEGQLASSASSILMKLMWISRLARPDVLRATTWLATKIHCWNRACDAHLHRVMSYLFHTQESLLTGWILDKPSDIFLEMFVDADFCGDEDDCYSTSGGWIQLTGPSTQFPLAWISKKQSTVARSTTEAETVALNFVLFEEGLPLLELFKVLFGPDVKLKVREDNEATAKVVTTGYSKKLRYLKRTQKISLSSLAEELNKDDVSLALVRSLDQKADVFTKAVAGGLWANAMKLLEIVQEYEIISSTQTGLKLTIDFNEAIGQTPAPVQTGLRQGYKKKQKVKPTRIPLYSKE